MARILLEPVSMRKGRRHMRRTSLDLDQESTIISMLAVRHVPDVGPSSKSSPILKFVLGGGAALLLVLVVLQGHAPWQ